MLFFFFFGVRDYTFMSVCLRVRDVIKTLQMLRGAHISFTFSLSTRTYGCTVSFTVQRAQSLLWKHTVPLKGVSGSSSPNGQENGLPERQWCPDAVVLVPWTPSEIHLHEDLVMMTVCFRSLYDLYNCHCWSKVLSYCEVVNDPYTPMYTCGFLCVQNTHL